MMHWTLSALFCVAAACLFGNAIQQAKVGSVRPVGIAVCMGWVAQQAIWYSTGSDSLAVFLLCDGIILWLAWRDRHWTALAIIGLMAVCWACYFDWGPERSKWWINWTAVVLQMVLGLPWPALQRIGFSISHGTRRGEAT